MTIKRVVHDISFSKNKPLAINKNNKISFFQSAVKDVDSGNPVKFGYVVFAEKGIAQKVILGVFKFSLILMLLKLYQGLKSENRRVFLLINKQTS